MNLSHPPSRITLAIWAAVAVVFVADLRTPADDVTVCFAYVIPIVATLLEPHPVPLVIGAVSSALSVAGMLIQLPTRPLTVVMNSIAILAQILVSVLVKLHQSRLVEAVESAELQRRFVDILSHETGTALNAVIGQAYRLTKLADQLTPGDLRVRAEKIRRAAERIHSIVDRIQFASRLGDGSIPAGQERVDVGALVKHLADQMRDEHRGARIDLITPAHAPRLVIGDEMLLRQAFENILLNCIKYSPSGAPIELAVVDRGPIVRVVATDRGSGIHQEELLRVHTAYYRGRNSEGIRGAGLGLYIVQKLIEAHHGQVFIQSEPGNGTKVMVDLPLADAAGTIS